MNNDYKRDENQNTGAQQNENTNPQNINNDEKNQAQNNPNMQNAQQTETPRQQYDNGVNYQSASHTTEEPFKNQQYSRYYGTAQDNSSKQQNPPPQNPYRTNNDAYNTQDQNAQQIPSFGNMNAPQNPYFTPQNPKKEKNRNGNVLTGRIIALVVCCCLVCSGLFGIGGAFIGAKIAGDDKAPTTLNTTNDGSNHSSGLTYYSSSDQNNGKLDGDNAMVNAISGAKDAVVEISTETVVNGSYFGQYVSNGAGSGVIISTDGYIITCAHVVDGSSAVTVMLSDGTKYPAKLIGQDNKTDIAVIKIEAKNLKAAVIGNSDNLAIGETAIAIGNPLGELGGTVTSGIISALDREVTIGGTSYKLLQTNAAINPGNSGGGLFNINGELVGIVNAKSAGSEIEGLGFAIPIKHAIEIADQLVNYGYIKGRVMLGIMVKEINASTSSFQLSQSEYSSLLNYITDYGVYFVEYQSGQSGDLKFGDRIVALDGTAVSSQSDISSALENYSIGDKIKITVARLETTGRNQKSKMIDIDITLIENVPENVNNPEKSAD